jgi:hypothetical protein
LSRKISASVYRRRWENQRKFRGDAMKNEDRARNGPADVKKRRTRMDWTRQMQRLADEGFPDADKVVLVNDDIDYALVFRTVSIFA